MKLVTITDAAVWDLFVEAHPWGHPLQLWGWGEAKRGNGWVPHRLGLMVDDRLVAGAQVLLWPIPRTGRFIVYVPRGPVADPASADREAVLAGLVDWARAHHGLYVRIEPAWLKRRLRARELANGEAESAVQLGQVPKLPVGWLQAQNRLQLPGTFTIDVSQSLEDIQLPMSRKHRQYIRKAERDGVSVVLETSGNLRPMYDIYSQTAVRAGFGIHTEDYYAELFRGLGEHNRLYYALVNDQPAAFLWLAQTGSTAYELYGGVTEAGQEAKANYFLKWTAIQNTKNDGIVLYDFNGRLNEGVSRFKEGFGADETDWIGTYDYPINGLGYQLWEKLWPVAKPIGRRILKAVRK